VLKFYQRLSYNKKKKRGKKSIQLRDKAGFYHQSDASQRQLFFEKASSMTQHLHLL